MFLCINKVNAVKIQITKRKRKDIKMKTRKFGLVIGLLLIAVIAVGGLWLLKNPVGYISIDVTQALRCLITD